MRKIFLFVIIFVISFNSCLYSVNGASVDSQIKSQKKSQSDMKKKISRYNAIAKEKSKQSKTLLSQLSKLRQDASESQAQMQNLERRNSTLQKSVNELNAKIKRVNESMSVIIKTLRQRIPEIYKFSPDESKLNLILNSSGAHEAVNTSYMLGLFARQDQKMLEELLRQQEELISARKKLEADKSQIQRQTDELKKKRSEYDSTIKKTDTLLKNVQNEQKQAEAAAKELEKAQRAVGNKINSLMNQKKKSAEKKSNTASKSNSKTTAKNSTPSTPSKLVGNALSWPVNGTVTMQYGSRVHPVFKTKIFNSGIDIKASQGTPVKAAGAGEVLYQGWLRGFGQVVIIDHGGDISTVYAHLGGASVREGSTVKAGTVIGRVGNSGTNSEYGLHFEVRKNGSAQNPMNYLR
ncbi:MAG: peptidoglycan DD-metalloendopeptidase family protein [Synergistaceae bacterium]|nr:peptidoglycan DD-metalloendopeptidase family protein [Synergistaceae bacterium]